MLPPYGKQYLEELPSAGIWVAIGPGAWRFAKTRSFPVMVLPEDHEPSDYEWPANGQPVLIHERGQFDDERLQAMAKALLLAGAPSVAAMMLAWAGEALGSFSRVTRWALSTI